MDLWQPGNEPPGDYMMLSLYFTLGIFLLLAVRNPSAHRSLIPHAGRANIARAAVMVLMAIHPASDRKGLLIGVEIDTSLVSARTVCDRLLAHGILSKDTHDTVVRFGPVLNQANTRHATPTRNDAMPCLTWWWPEPASCPGKKPGRDLAGSTQ